MERSREDVRGLCQAIIKDGYKDAALSAWASLGATKLSEIEDVDLGAAYDALMDHWAAAQLKKKPLSKGERFKYGERWTPFTVEKKGPKGQKTLVPVRELSDVEIEMKMFLRYEEGKWLPGGLGRYEHCKRGVEMIWHKQSKKPVTFNPYAEAMFKGFCKHKYLGVASHASGGKSFNLAVWSIWNFLCAPWHTKVFITSTTLKDSQGRIWGDVLELWGAAVDSFGGDMPGKPVPSDGIIRCTVDGRATDKAGLSLIAGDPKKASENMGKFIGFKRDRLFLICDEMPELSEALLASAEGNLVTGGRFQMIGIGNPASYYDAFGKFCEPKQGWGSITETDYEWEGVKAVVLRFDAKNSPNVVARDRGDYSNPFPGLLKWEVFEESKERLKENSPSFYRMYRAFWCPTGAIESIYTEQEIITYGADKPAGYGWKWLDIPVMLCGLDPAFKKGGDRAIAYFAQYGLSTTKIPTFCLIEYVQLEQNVNNPEPRDMQIIRQLALEMQKRGVAITNLGVDVTGAASFGTLVSQHIGAGFMAVEFGGKPSDMPASSIDKRPAKDVYDRKVAELWHVGKELISTGQLKGLHPDAIKEMVARTYGVSGGKIWVEPKTEMKKRIGFSPDVFDAAVVALDVARMRHGLVSGAKAKEQPKATDGPTESPWAAFARKVKETETFFGQSFTYGG